VRQVNRSALQDDAVRKAVRAAGYGHLLLTDQQLAHSLRTTLAQRTPGEPVWIFGYGSLVWSPMFEYAERRVARLRGYHRGFYLWSRINRGSPDVPGLVLGLDRGGSCGGMAYRLSDEGLIEELDLLWRREMLTGTYQPRWTTVETHDRRVRAIAFVVDRSKPGYAGRLTDQQILATVARARGHYGTCTDYLTQTALTLERHGIADRRLSRLARLIAQQTRNQDGQSPVEIPSG
jgi:cation transport protein ChaC